MIIFVQAKNIGEHCNSKIMRRAWNNMCTQSCKSADLNYLSYLSCWTARTSTFCGVCWHMDEAFLIKWQIDIQLPLHNFAIKVRNTKITPQYSYHKHSKLYKLKLLSRHIYGTMGYVDKIGKSGFWGSMWLIYCVWQSPQWIWT